MTYVVCFEVTGGISIEAESESDAIQKFRSGEYDVAVGTELAQNSVTITDVFEAEDD